MKNIQLILCALLVLSACRQSNNTNEASKPTNEQKVETTSQPIVTETNQPVEAKPSGPIKIIQLETKTRIGKGAMKSQMRWYTFYMENYIDNKETENKMIEIAKKLPVDNQFDSKLGMNRGGFTEVFFFKDKTNAPKLASNGGWIDDESQNSWNMKYGKFCVGYYSAGAGDNGTFSKGWN
jgi:hypothetical protein